MLAKSDYRTLYKLISKAHSADLVNLFLALGADIFGTAESGPAHDCPACRERHQTYLELRRQLIECAPQDRAFAGTERTVH